MSVTAFGFLLFAGVLLAVYYAIPGKGQWMLLLAASWFFCLRDGLGSLIFILLTTLTTYGTALRMQLHREGYPREAARRKNRKWLWLYLVSHLGVLAICKVRFRFRGILLPMGISFYLFQSMGYVLDVYRGTIRAERSMGRLALYVSFFSQLVQGPISSYGHLAPQLLAPHPFDGRQLSMGLQRMLWGYFKKLVIADRIAPAVAALKDGQYSGISFFVLTVFYAIQIYGDFTGGIDIALGLAEALGICLPENFHRPFFSESVAQYWRRWHITLGEWMKTYVFYPVSVSVPMRRLSRAARKKWPKFGKRLPVYGACFVTWCCTGLWHGLSWNFLLWGLMNWAVIVMSEELSPLYESVHRRFPLKKKPWYHVLAAMRTLLLMGFIRIVDLFPDVGEYFRRLGTMLHCWRVPFMELGLTGLDYGILLCGCILMLCVSLAQEKYGSVRQLLWKHTALRYALVFALLLVVLLMGSYGVGYDPASFIYNQF